MSRKRNYQGVYYTVSDSGGGRWRWEINPPPGVLGLYPESGHVIGKELDAVTAAQKVIDRQTSRFMQG